MPLFPFWLEGGICPPAQGRSLLQTSELRVLHLVCQHSTGVSLQFTCASNWRRLWERIGGFGTHLIHVDWETGSRDDAACAGRHRSLCGSLQANELADEQAKKGSAPHPSVEQVEPKLQRKDLVPVLVAEGFRPASCTRETRRGWSDVAPRVQSQRRALPGKLVVFQREPRRKRATHTPSSRARTRRRRASFGSAGGAGSAPHNGRNVSRDGVAESCRAGAEYSRSSRMAETQRTEAGWRSLPGMRWAGRTWSRWLRRKLDGTDVTWLMCWSAMDSAWTSLMRDTNLTCHCSARTCASLLDLFGR